MGRIIDLSYPLGGGSAVVPGHPDVEYKCFHTHEREGRTNATLFFSIHVGTHVDPPFHFDSKGWTIDDVPLDRLMGQGYVFRVADRAKSRKPITVEDVVAGNVLPKDGLKGKIVILHTGWGREAYHRPDYYTAGPYLSVELARWLVEQGVHAVGLENPPDANEPGGPHPGDAPIHRTLLGHGVCIIENLANLETLARQEIFVSALPLKIYRGCGGPARVIAIED